MVRNPDSALNLDDFEHKFKHVFLIDVVKSSSFLIDKDGRKSNRKALRLNNDLERLCERFVKGFKANDPRVQYTGDGFYLFLEMDPQEAIDFALKIIKHTQKRKTFGIRIAISSGFLTRIPTSKLYSGFQGVSNFLISRISKYADESQICFDNRIYDSIVDIHGFLEKKFKISITWLKNCRLKGFEGHKPPIRVYKIKPNPPS